MTDDDEQSERKVGILTRGDKKWLGRGEADGSGVSKSDQKRRCKEGIAAAMEDIQWLVETDFENVSNVDQVYELFEDVEEHTDMELEEAMSYLISLTFLVCNRRIDYEEIASNVVLHPKWREMESEETKQIQERDIPTKGAATAAQSITELLMFRRALSGGIKRGKKRLGDDCPNVVLVSTNTELYLEPKRDEINSGMDTEHMAEEFAQPVDPANPFSEPKTEETKKKIDTEDIVDSIITEIKSDVYDRIADRRALTDTSVPTYLP